MDGLTEDIIADITRNGDIGVRRVSAYKLSHKYRGRGREGTGRGKGMHAYIPLRKYIISRHGWILCRGWKFGRGTFAEIPFQLRRSDIGCLRIR